ncbi:helix-turn-helix domain-containing protein [Mesorhizobium abyssinicae]|nr:helix-turn-helix domain-containing protein [Mesorhizobium abyssinicae]MDX8435332.1 helix-turn-helix domain-containing protein [Mesorhizobium abyssinicae]
MRLSFAEKKETAVSSKSPRLLTTEEAAKYVRLSMPTLAKLRTVGGGPAYRKLANGKSGQVVYALSDLNAWLGGRRRPDTSAIGKGPSIKRSRKHFFFSDQFADAPASSNPNDAETGARSNNPRVRLTER